MNCSRYRFIVSLLLRHGSSSTTPATPPSASTISVLRYYSTFRRLPLSLQSCSRPVRTSRATTMMYSTGSAEPLKTPTDTKTTPDSAETIEQPEPSDDEDLEHVTLKLTPAEIQELTNGNEELINKIKLIQMEHELARQDGARVPPRPIKLRKWKELLELNSRHQRMKYFNYLWNCQMAEDSDKKRKQAKREQRVAEISANPLPSPEEDPYGVTYGLNRNTIFLRLYDSTQNRFHHSRMATAALFNQTMVIDCSYDEFMTRAEAKNCAGQLEYLLTENRTHSMEPMNIVMCNVDRKSKLIDALSLRIPTLFEDSYMMQIYEGSYLDLFPKERLLYLTPHARDELMTHNEDDIYIVGAMVDKTDPRPFSMAKAKREGLRTAKLPLDQYLEWGGGSGKCLTVNQMGRILVDFSNTKDWSQALRHVPSRKLRRTDELIPSDRFILQQPKAKGGKYRKERPSQVVLDFELQKNRQKFGFKSAQGPIGPELNRGRFRPEMKSILHDE